MHKGNFHELGVRSTKLFLSELDGIVRIRRPVCANVYTVLGCLFQVEEQVVSEKAEECRASESLEDPGCARRAYIKSVIQDVEDCANDRPKEIDK